MDKLLLGLTALRPGQIPVSRDVTLTITPGEGRAWLEPGQPPTLGTISQGRLVLESETFPRFAPLTLTLTGADLGFRVRDRKLINFGFKDAEQHFLRLHCTGIFRAAYRYRLFQPMADQIIVTRTNTLLGDCDDPLIHERFSGPDIHCRTMLQVHVLEGEVVTSPDYQTGPLDIVEYGGLELVRNVQGVLKLQLHGARIVLDLSGGSIVGLRVYDSRGTVANFSLLDGMGAGVSATVAIVDTLP